MPHAHIRTTKVVSVYQYGRLLSVSNLDSAGNAVGSVSYGYDAHGRVNTITDTRCGQTTCTFNDLGSVTSVITPVPGNGQAAQTTTTYYDSMQRPVRMVQPDGSSVTNEYYVSLRGQTRV